MVDPLSYFSFHPGSTTGVTKAVLYNSPVCEMVHINDPLLVIGQTNHEVAAMGFLSVGPYKLVRSHIGVLSRTEEPAKPGTCARDRRALQQLALNMHVKH